MDIKTCIGKSRAQQHVKIPPHHKEHHDSPVQPEHQVNKNHHQEMTDVHQFQIHWAKERTTRQWKTTSNITRQTLSWNPSREDKTRETKEHVEMH